MTHFIGAVIVPKNVPWATRTSPTQYPDLYGRDAKEWQAGEALQRFLQQALDKFDENKETPRYVKYTKEQAIENSRNDVKEYAERTYAEFLKDPAAYEANSHNPDHIRYLKEDFPKKLNWTDEEHFAAAIEYLEDDEYDAEGNIYSEYNPHSTWDWWTIGGRWEKTYRERQGETVEEFLKAAQKAVDDAEDPQHAAQLAAVEAKVSAAAELMRAREITYDAYEKVRAELLECPAYFPWWFPRDIVVSENGEFEWKKQGRTGWWGFRDQDVTDLEWAKSVVEILKTNDPQDRIIYIDFHI